MSKPALLADDPRYQDFLRAVLEPVPRLSVFGPFGDWIEEHYSPDELKLAAAYRWCAKHRVRPVQRSPLNAVRSRGETAWTFECLDPKNKIAHTLLYCRREGHDRDSFEACMAEVAEVLAEFVNSL